MNLIPSIRTLAVLCAATCAMLGPSRAGATAPSDTTPPEVSVLAAKTTGILPGETLAVEVMAWDAEGVTKVRLKTDGLEVEPQTVPVSPPSAQVTMAFTLMIPADAAPGTSFLVIGVARDAANNVGRAKVRVALAPEPGTVDEEAPTPTPSNTTTPSKTPTDTRTPRFTRTPTPTKTPSLTKTATPTKTPSSTKTPSLTKTPSSTKTSTPTRTPTLTRTATGSPGVPSPTATDVATATPVPTDTAAPVATDTPTEMPTATPSSTDTATETPTATDTATETPTETPTATDTATETPTETPTATDTATETPTETPTETSTPTFTPVDTATPTPTPTETPTPSPTPTETPAAQPVCVTSIAAAAAVNDGSNLGVLSWTNAFAAMVCASPSANVRVPRFSSGLSTYLRVTGYGFSSIPDTATVVGITLTLEKDRLGPGSASDARVSLVNTSGVITAENKAQAGNWPALAPVVYGSDTDTWGESWTGADVKSANFGWVVSANTVRNDSFTADFNAFINCGRVRVCYLP